MCSAGLSLHLLSASGPAGRSRMAAAGLARGAPCVFSSSSSLGWCTWWLGSVPREQPEDAWSLEAYLGCSFCHILLAKASDRASPHSRGGEIVSMS